MDQSTCLVKGCEKAPKASRGWCWKHYNAWRRHGDPEWRFVQGACAAKGCESMSRVRGMCDKHYRRFKKYGDPDMGGRPAYGDTCESHGCAAATHQAGLCVHHYYLKWTTEGNGKEVQAAASARRRAAIASAAIDDRDLSWRTLWAEGLRACYLCGITCDPTDYRRVLNRGGRMQKICGPEHPSLDHIVPLAHGGTHARINSALACSQCNRRKHTKSITELFAGSHGQAEHGDAGSYAPTRPPHRG